MMIALVLIVIQAYECATPINNKTVTYAAIIFRHGERYPLADGVLPRGQLTTRGQQQMLELGRRLKAEYNPSDSQILVHSANVTRCIRSAQLLLRSFLDYKNTTPAIDFFGENGIDWTLMVPVLNCSKYFNEMRRQCANLNAPDAYQNYDDIETDLMHCSLKSLNAKYFNTSHGFEQVEALVANLEMNRTLLDDAAKEATQIFQAVNEMVQGYGAYKNRNNGKTNAGLLLSNIYKKIAANDRQPLIHLISTQDWILASMLVIFDVADEWLGHENPAYTSSVRIECWKQNNVEFVGAK